jgi:molybdate transport system regulatory protein
MAGDSIKVDSALTLRGVRGLAASERWLELLAQLEQKRSIVRAAKAVGLSYKAAWDAIDTMNNLAEQALVERSAGGRGGGGTRLTASGEQLVRTYQLVRQENSLFLQRLNQQLGATAGELRLLGRIGMRSSARNQFSGTVARVRAGAVNDEIEVELKGGQRLTALITCESTQQLALARGVAVVAWVKASSVMIACEDEDVSARSSMRLSARNRLRGQIARLVNGAVSTEVVVALPGGTTVAASITKTSARELRLRSGMRVSAIFQASSVILGAWG